MIAQDSTDPTGVAVVSPSADKTAARRARTRKVHAAIELRLAGTRWDDIAQVVGYPTGRLALVAVEKALEKELLTQGDRDVMRRLAGARLDRMLRSVWGKAVNEKHPEHLVAVTKAREIVAQHAKLFGLDAPTEIIVHSPTAKEIEAWVARVISTSTPDVEEYDILTDDDVVDAEVVEPQAIGR